MRDFRHRKEVRFDPCSSEGCESVGALYDVRRRLCKRHYSKLHGSGQLPPLPDVYGLMSQWRRITDEGCWEWRGAVGGNGYGQYAGQYIHRLSYEATIGPIPDGLEIDHLCRNRQCFRPDHLEAVTHAVNVQRGELAWILQEGCCSVGHDMTPENTRLYVTKRGHERRICRACHRRRNAKSQKRSAA